MVYSTLLSLLCDPSGRGYEGTRAWTTALSTRLVVAILEARPCCQVSNLNFRTKPMKVHCLSMFLLAPWLLKVSRRSIQGILRTDLPGLHRWAPLLWTEQKTKNTKKNKQKEAVKLLQWQVMTSFFCKWIDFCLPCQWRKIDPELKTKSHVNIDVHSLLCLATPWN